MFRNLLNKLRGSELTPPPSGIRDVLFGDLPLTEWPRPGAELDATEPWTWFVAAQQAVAAGQPAEAEAEARLRQVLAAEGLESRHYLQAWQALRELGQQPTETEARQVLGVVVEVGMNEGLDIVAAYADGSARYYNFSGAGVVWERPDDSLTAPIQGLLDAGQRVAAHVGTWDQPRPAAPLTGSVRISMLTPGGLRFGQAPFDTLWQDALGGPVLAAAQGVMTALIAKSGQNRRG